MNAESVRKSTGRIEAVEVTGPDGARRRAFRHVAGAAAGAAPVGSAGRPCRKIEIVHKSGTVVRVPEDIAPERLSAIVAALGTAQR